MQKKPFISFNKSVAHIELPKRFTFPFYYEPHALSLEAVSELQDYLTDQTDWEHNFGLGTDKQGLVIGKMFGVLVVQDEQGNIGYLAAYSGKLAGNNQHEQFVPPIFDMLTDGGFFNEGMEGLDLLNQRVIKLEADPSYEKYKLILQEESLLASDEIEARREVMRQAKAARKIRKTAVNALADSSDKQERLSVLIRESLSLKAELRHFVEQWSIRLAKASDNVDRYTNELIELKQARKDKSQALQKRLFDNYHFLNQAGVEKSLWEIFKTTALKNSPSGAGECAAPKLLQYAFANNLKPVALTEFWWGASPKSEIRKHGHFYPACRGKCEPILGHMLEGMELDDNPMLIVPSLDKELSVVYEDDQILAINKPAEFLSVPGKTILDSVHSRILKEYPELTGPIIVHRLDMATSGLMLIAKNKHVHKILQRQFIERTIKKRYVAVLDGLLNDESGTIDLPIRLDIDDRPRQLVCYVYGKPAQTEWKVIERKDGKTKVHFFPITGRTHQLRVHAAHSDGLNLPIVGDDLYGKRGERLHLHAEWIEFMHPMTRERMELQVDSEF
jgi:tRNA pseudouridine32 synthase/23S rRNA pseudouridine746 synthase